MWGLPGQKLAVLPRSLTSTRQLQLQTQVCT